MTQPDAGQPVLPDDVATPPAVAWWSRDRVAIVVLVVVTALLWWIRRRGPAWSMEEAMMLQAPVRVLDGAVPGRDFDYFYGPLSLLIPAGVYRLASPTLLAERAVGAGYVLIVGVALQFIGRRWSFAIGLTMGLIGVLVGGLSMTALPIMGAIGGLTAVVAFAVSDLAPRPKAVSAGLAGAFAVGLRPEFLAFVIIVMAALTLTRTVRPVAWIAAALGLAPFGWMVATAGFGTTWRNLVTDAMHVASERHLPWHANLSGTGILAILGALTAAVALAIGIRRRHDVRGVALLGLGIIGLCLVPEYLQRADAIHVVYVTMVPLATVVPVAYELAGGLDVLRRRSTWRQVAAIGVALVVVCGLRPKFIARATLRDLRTTITGTNVFEAVVDGNVWYYRDADTVRDRETLARAAAELARPGDTLFVGPAALDRPNYTDGSFYTLLPGYVQHTHFYDFHPRIAQVDGERLAADVATADVVILCATGFDEDNLSNRPGSTAANEVVAERFDPVAEAGNCRLYQRADVAAARR